MEELQSIVKSAILRGKLRKGVMYRSYHAFVTGSLTVEWELLEQQMQETFDPSLPQLIANSYLRSTIKDVTDSLLSPCTSRTTRKLTEIEENAIMFAGGYIVGVLIDKHRKGSQPVSADFVSCLAHMLEGSSLDIDEDESFESCAVQWVKISNRGGSLTAPWGLLALL